MKRKKPSFNEAYHGYRTFSELLEDAQKEGLLELETDKRSGTYVVTRFGGELSGPAPPPRRSSSSSRRRPRSRGGRMLVVNRPDADRRPGPDEGARGQEPAPRTREPGVREPAPRARDRDDDREDEDTV